MVGQRPGGRLPPLNVSSSVPSTVCPSPRGMRSAALTASASAPSLSAPGSRLPSRISLRPRSDLHPLGSRTHHAGSKARKKPPLLAPLDSEGSFERAAGKLYLSLQMLSSDLQHVKGKLNDSDYRYDGPRERLVDLHDLRSQAVRHLGHKVAQIEVGGGAAHTLFNADSPWRARAFQQTSIVRAPIPRSPVKLLSPRRHSGFR